MEAAEFNFNLIDSYLGLLSSLSPENKLELIRKLSATLKSLKPSGGQSLTDLFGCFVSAKTADEIINDLKVNRNFDRNTEQF
jgi:hypothetical protein